MRDFGGAGYGDAERAARVGSIRIALPRLNATPQHGRGLYFATALTHLERKQKKTDDVVESICDAKNFRVYKMIPPTMEKG